MRVVELVPDVLPAKPPLHVLKQLSIHFDQILLPVFVLLIYDVVLVEVEACNFDHVHVST